jgi:N6-L-threonylcarbamoyladenine synthase
VARLLGLGYPGGPAIEAAGRDGDPRRFALPKGRVSRPEGGYYPYDFSFSGLKTAMLRQVRALEAVRDVALDATPCTTPDGMAEPLPLADLAASFEQVVAEVLVERSCRCARDLGLGTLVLVGGVAANRRLRALLEQQATARNLSWRVAPLAWCTDNAAMIALAGERRFAAGRVSAIGLGVAPRLPLEQADRLYERQPCF